MECSGDKNGSSFVEMIDLRKSRGLHLRDIWTDTGFLCRGMGRGL